MVVLLVIDVIDAELELRLAWILCMYIVLYVETWRR